jgi:hypothetical protein
VSADVTPIEGWVRLELLGHRVLHGELSVGQLGPEATGPIVLRLDVPSVDDRPAELHFYTPQAVYGIHPTTELAVVEALTPWRAPERCGKPVASSGTTCDLRTGHDGDCDDGLPF